jgi:hypothetical protein
LFWDSAVLLALARKVSVPRVLHFRCVTFDFSAMLLGFGIFQGADVQEGPGYGLSVRRHYYQ